MIFLSLLFIFNNIDTLGTFIINVLSINILLHMYFIPSCSAPVLLLNYSLFYGYPFFRYRGYPVRGYQLATNIITKHPRLRKGAVINGSGGARVVTVAASAYNSERAVCWLDASIRNKAPTMQSSLTSSSRVNRASRDRGRGEISRPGRRRCAAPRPNFSRIYEDGRSMTQFSSLKNRSANENQNPSGRTGSLRD